MKDYINENKAAYDAIAMPFSQSRIHRFGELPLIGHFVQPGMTVVDLGCGTGRLYQFLAQNQGLESVRYIGVDQSKGQLEVAAQEYPDGEWLMGTMQSIPVEDESIDILYCIATFHHLPDTETRIAALQEMKRVLKPDGLLVMSNWNFESEWVESKLQGPETPGINSMWKRDGDHFMVPWMNPKREILGTRHYWAISPEEHKKLQTDAGFVFEEWFYTRQDEKIGDIKLGMNIITIAKKV